MTKQVKISKKLHKKLVYLKETNNAKSINDVIEALIDISEEFYTNNGTLNVVNKRISFRYDNGKIVEIQIEKID